MHLLRARREGAPDARGDAPGLPTLPAELFRELATKRVALAPSRHPVAVYLARLGNDRSRATCRGALERVAHYISAGRLGAESLAWHELRYQHVVAIRSFLAYQYTPGVANQYLGMVRSVLEQAWRLGHVAAEDYFRARDVDPIGGMTLPAGRMLHLREISRLLRACREDPFSARGRRDACAIALMYGCGLRRAELVGLDLEHVDTSTVPVQLKVHGKGRRERIAYVPTGAVRALTKYLEVRGADPGPLLYPLDPTRHRYIPRRLDASSVWYELRRRGRRIHLRDFSPHDLRRSFVSHLLANGADLSAASQLAGHSSVQTTARYDRRGEEAVKQAAELITVPYE